MRPLRRYGPPLAALLLVLIAAQTLDLPGCLDEVGHTATATTAVPSGAPSPQGHDDDGAAPDCLCHVVFVPQVRMPSLGAPVVRRVTPPPLREVVLDALLSPPDHVPLA